MCVGGGGERGREVLDAPMLSPVVAWSVVDLAASCKLLFLPVELVLCLYSVALFDLSTVFSHAASHFVFIFVTCLYSLLSRISNGNT